MSAAKDTAVAAITRARNFMAYGVAVNGAAIEGIANVASAGDVISGPLALASAVQVAGWQAQYAVSLGYMKRALTNAQIGII